MPACSVRSDCWPWRWPVRGSVMTLSRFRTRGAMSSSPWMSRVPCWPRTWPRRVWSGPSCWPRIWSANWAAIVSVWSLSPARRFCRRRSRSITARFSPRWTNSTPTSSRKADRTLPRPSAPAKRPLAKRKDFPAPSSSSPTARNSTPTDSRLRGKQRPTASVFSRWASDRRKVRKFRSVRANSSAMPRAKSCNRDSTLHA